MGLTAVAMWRSAAFAAVLVALTGVSACSSNTVGAAFEYEGSPLTDLTVEGAELVAVLAAAEDVLVAPCMIELGFEYELVREFSDVDPDPVVAPELSVERAEEFGYRQPEYRTGDITTAYVESLTESARAEYARALFGSGARTVDVETGFGLLSVPADGCLADARAELAGSVEAAAGWTAALNEIEFLRADANNRTLADADVVAATSEWAGCMKASGFDVAAPHAAVELAWSKDYNEAGEASDWEILVATTDTRCRVEADLDRITEDRRSYYENAVLGDNEGVVLAWGETRDAVHAILSELLDLGG